MEKILGAMVGVFLLVVVSAGYRDTVIIRACRASVDAAEAYLIADDALFSSIESCMRGKVCDREGAIELEAAAQQMKQAFLAARLVCRGE